LDWLDRLKDLVDPLVRAELLPTGRLRAAIAVGPIPSAVFAVEARDGTLTGVPVTLACSLAERLGCELTLLPFDSSGAIQSTAGKNRWDISFMPADQERRALVDFSRPYHLAESTYLVAESSGIFTVEEVNRPGMRIVALLNTATRRASMASTPLAEHYAAASMSEALAMLWRGEADALALGKDALGAIARTHPGMRVVEGAFFRSATAIALRKDLPHAQGYLSAFVENAIANGQIRAAFDSVGLTSAAVAPLETTMPGDPVPPG